MNQENKNKIAVIGYTKGIGKAIVDLYKEKQYEIVGLGRSNGFDLLLHQDEIMEKIEDCGLVVINVHSGRGQLNLLKRILHICPVKNDPENKPYLINFHL